MEHLGNVIEKDRKYFARVDTNEGSVRFYMEGPLRTDQHEARQDLDYIRSVAEGSLTRAEALQCMKSAAKELRAKRYSQLRPF